MTTFLEPYLVQIYNACQANANCKLFNDFYYTYLKNIFEQFGFGIIVGLYFVGMSMLLVVWDWLPLSFRLLFMGKPSDYNWDEPYTY